MKLYKIFLVLFLLAADAAGAADLAHLQQLALENRQVLDRYRTNLAMSQTDETIARSGFYPSVDLYYTLNALDESSALENKENSVVYGALTWNLFAGFRDRYSLESAEVLQQVEMHKLKALEQDISLAVALRYLAIYDRKAQLTVAEDSHNTLIKVHQDAENRFAVGLIKKNDLLRFKVDLDNAVITLKKAQAELSKNVQLLAREIQAAVSLNELQFEEFKKLPVGVDPRQCETSMLLNRSEIKALQETAKALNMQVKSASAGYYPRVDLTTSYRRYEESFMNGTGDDYNDEVRGQLVLSMNLFDGKRTASRVSKAKLAAQAVQYDRQELENDLKVELHNLFLDVDVSTDNAAVAESSIEQAEENLRITRLRWQEGLETESDLLDAITSLSRAKYNYVTAKSSVFADNYKITRMLEGF